MSRHASSLLALRWDVARAALQPCMILSFARDRDKSFIGQCAHCQSRSTRSMAGLCRSIAAHLCRMVPKGSNRGVSADEVASAGASEGFAAPEAEASVKMISLADSAAASKEPPRAAPRAPARSRSLAPSRLAACACAAASLNSLDDALFRLGRVGADESSSAFAAAPCAGTAEGGPPSVKLL